MTDPREKLLRALKPGCKYITEGKRCCHKPTGEQACGYADCPLRRTQL